MSKRLLIERDEERLEFALMRDRDLLFYAKEQVSSGGPEAEEIYLARVNRIAPGMEAAFVRLTREGTVGFLPFDQCREKPRSGELMLLQVRRPPVGDKAAAMTADLSLAGRYVILTPLSARCAVSKRVEDPDTREALLHAARRLAPQGMGLVMRANSIDVEEEAIAGEIEALRAEYLGLADQALRCEPPRLLRERPDVLDRFLRDEQGSVDEAFTNAPESLPDDFPIPVSRHAHPFDLFGVRDKLRASFQRKVWLPCGGNLILDKTEALTVIDVNSGKFTGKKSGAEDTFLKLNLEAAREIARLLRLRNIGGIVIVDFVDMQSDESRAAVAQALADALRDDPVKTVLHGFTALGLMEMTRKKSGE